MGLKEKLQQIEDTFAVSQRAREAQHHEAVTEARKFWDEYKQIEKTNIHATMREAADFLLSKNHAARIDTSDDGVALLFCSEPLPTGQIETSVRGYARVAFRCDRDKRVVYVNNHPPGADSTIRLRDCTKNFVEDCIERVAKAVIV